LLFFIFLTYVVRAFVNKTNKFNIIANFLNYFDLLNDVLSLGTPL